MGFTKPSVRTESRFRTSSDSSCGSAIAAAPSCYLAAPNPRPRATTRPLSRPIPPHVTPTTLNFLTLAGATLTGALLTRACMGIAQRMDFVSRPSGERWSKRPVALGGGVAIYAVLIVGLAACSWDLALAASAVFLLGLVDDRRELSPKIKLAVQAVAALWVVWGPLDLGPAPLLLEGPPVLAWIVTGCWYIGMSNSLNLLDNMDGSAAGVAAIAALFCFALGGGSADLSFATLVAAGAALGFLCWNFPPAKVYMGDAGSLLLGFSLAGLAVRIPTGGVWWRGLIAPACVLGIPLFDTALVWFSRRAAQRPFLQGGRDHSTHRLMALGLSPRRTLLVLYGVAASLGGLALAVARGSLGTTLLSVVVAGVVLILLGVLLGEVSVYRDASGRALLAPSRHPAFLYGVEILVDLGILTGCWLGAYALRFGGMELPEGGPALPFYLSQSGFPGLPFVLGSKVVALLLFRLYRGFWRTIRIGDVLRVAQAVSLASLLIVVMATVLDRFENYSRGVIAIDWVLSLLAILASRSALRLLRETLLRLSGRQQRAVLLASPDLRELLEASLGAEPAVELVATLAPGGTPEATLQILAGHGAEVLIVPTTWSEEDPLLAAALGAGLQVRRLGVVLE